MITRLKTNYLSIVVLASASSFFFYDIVTDIARSTDNPIHITIEGIIFIAISIVCLVEIKRTYRLHQQVQLEKQKVGALSGELFQIILDTFNDWKLSESEKEIALLIIKGLSMKEISELRHVKEKTIRQQAASIYEKTGLSGRHELASYFIEDLIGKQN